MTKDQNNLLHLIEDLCNIPGLAGYETYVKQYIEKFLKNKKIKSVSDRLGNFSCTLNGNTKLPSIMIFAHMDQIGFIVKKIEQNGIIRVERVGGVSEKTLASTSVVVRNEIGNLIEGVIGNKSHHVTNADEKYIVSKYADLYFDFGFNSQKEVLSNGVNIGSPITFKPSLNKIGKNKIVGTAIDDRVNCAVILELIDSLKKIKNRPTVHLVFSVQEEFNLRGVIPITRSLKPDIAIQLDINIAADTVETSETGHAYLGGGPTMSMYSFHGRGTLNGLIPHPSLVELFTKIAKKNKISLQRVATSGLLTETSYVQLEGNGIACIDLGFPARYSHSPNEMCDLRDVIQLKKLIIQSIKSINNKINLIR